MKRVLLLLCLFALGRGAAAADDVGPPRDVRGVSAAAQRLLLRAIPEGAADRAVAIRDVIVVGDQALLTWQAGRSGGAAGFVRYAGRWWNAMTAYDAPCPLRQTAFPLSPTYSESTVDAAALAGAGLSPVLLTAAARHNAMFSRLSTGPPRALCDIFDVYKSSGPAVVTGGMLAASPREAGGFDVTWQYAANDASRGDVLGIRVRPPTTGEMIPYPTPARGEGGPTDVAFIDFDDSGKSAATFRAGSTLTIWAPFVLDDALAYELELHTARTAVGPFKGTLHDNTLTFTMPAFTLAPGETQAEIQGDW